MGKTSGKSRSSAKRGDADASEKKPRMRTAGEVVKRIRWDPLVDETKVDIGYLDRFKGVVQEPFVGFNWDDVVEHRLNYFKYNGEVVWDKRERLDNFFGSTGGLNIQAVILRQAERAAARAAEKAARRRRLAKMKRRSRRRAAGGDADDDGKEGDSAEEDDELMGDSDDDTDDDDDAAATAAAAEEDSGPTRKPRRHRSRNATRPNFFVVMPLRNKAIRAAALRLQQTLVALEPRLEDAIMPLQCMHVSILMVRLSNEEQVEKAKAVLHSCSDLLAELLPKGLRLPYKGVGCFRDRVLHTRPDPLHAEPLMAFQAGVRDRMLEAGIRIDAAHDEFVPHATIMKLSRALSREMGYIDRGLYLPFVDMDFGTQGVPEVHLCSMRRYRHDNWYITLAKVTAAGPVEGVELPMPLAALLPVPPKVMLMRQASDLAREGKMSAAEKLAMQQRIVDAEELELREAFVDLQRIAAQEAAVAAALSRPVALLRQTSDLARRGLLDGDDKAELKRLIMSGDSLSMDSAHARLRSAAAGAGSVPARGDDVREGGKAEDEEDKEEGKAEAHGVLDGIATVSDALMLMLRAAVDGGVLTDGKASAIRALILSAGEDGLSAALERLYAALSPAGKLPVTAARPGGVVTVVRGLSGSGKSHLVRSLQGDVVCSADSYFSRTGKYVFNVKQLGAAHAYCANTFVAALAARAGSIIVDNTNSQRWEYDRYVKLGIALGYEVRILEIACPDMTTAKLFNARNSHNVPFSTAKRMFKRWNKDSRATLMAHWTEDTPAPEAGALPLPLLREPQLPGSRWTALYAAVFLLPDAQDLLLSRLPAAHPIVHAGHMTIQFKPTHAQLDELRVGEPVQLVVQGSAADGKVQAAVVRCADGKRRSSNLRPHITVSTAFGGRPSMSNQLLKKPFDHLAEGFTLSGVTGLMLSDDWQYVRLTTEEGFRAYRAGRLHDFLRARDAAAEAAVASAAAGARTAAPAAAAAATDDDDGKDIAGLALTSEVEVITHLFIFDFDGTLFHSPSPDTGPDQLLALTGKPFRAARGWLDEPVSLCGQLPLPAAPALAAMRDHCGRSGSLTVILTGRIQPLTEQVRAAVVAAGLDADRYLCRPADMDTRAFKRKALRSLLAELPDVRHVQVWEDNDDMLELYRSAAAAQTRAGQTWQVHDVRAADDSKDDDEGDDGADDSVVRRFLAARGRLQTAAMRRSVDGALRLLWRCWRSVLLDRGLPVPAKRSDGCLQFGSFPLGRRADDIDVVLLTPEELPVGAALDALYAALQAAGVLFLYRADSRRCPRLKLKLRFEETVAVEMDVLIACTHTALPATAEELLAGASDSVSSRALDGPVLLSTVVSKLSGKLVSPALFAQVVEMLLLVLRAAGHKGNAFHCLRSFMLMQVVADMIAAEETRWSSADELFANMLVRLSDMPESAWRPYVGVWVPPAFLPMLVECWQLAASQLTRAGMVVTEELLNALMTHPVFPPDDMSVVRVEWSADSALLFWQMSTRLEARLPSAMRKLQAAGVHVIPDGVSARPGRLQFAVSHVEHLPRKVSSALSPVMAEMDAEFGRRRVYSLTKQLMSAAELAAMSGGASPVEAELAAIEDSDPDAKLKRTVLRFALREEGGELQLPDTLNSFERMLVHSLAEKHGLGHESRGDGLTRSIRIYHLAR